MTLASSIIAKAGIVNYYSRIVIYSFIVLATVIMIVNYDRTVITIINYIHKTFIVQATERGKRFTNPFEKLGQKKTNVLHNKIRISN